MVHVFYNCFCPLSVQLRRRYVKTDKEKEMTRRKEKKPKIRHRVVLVKKLRHRPVVFRFLLTSKGALSYMRKEEALLFFETQLTRNAVKFFLVVKLKASSYQHWSCVYLFRKLDPQIQRYKDTDNLS